MSTPIYEDRNYLIFPVDQLNLVDFNQVHERSADTVRKSIDGTKTFIKWNGAAPAFVSALTNTSGPYIYSEMLNILNTLEWTAPYTGSMP
jgi:hypothetical protein